MEPASAISLEQVVSAIEEVLDARGRRPAALNPELPLDELGLDSLDFAEVFVSLEQAVGYELDPESVGPNLRVRDLTTLRPL